MKAIAAAASLSFVIACGLARPAFAQEDTSAATAHRLMIRSGLSVQLRGLQAQMQADIQRNRGRLDERLVAALSQASSVAFEPAALQSDMTVRLARKLNVTQMNAALSWLESPAGQRVTRAEELGSAVFDEQRFAGYVRGLAAKPLSARRTEMLSSLVTETKVAETVYATQEAIALGVALGIDTLQPRERRLGEAAIRDRVRQMLPADKVKAALAQQLPVLYAYTYRDVSDADLAAYVAFLRSPAGRRYQEGMTATFVEGLAWASLQVGQLVGRQPAQTAL